MKPTPQQQRKVQLFCNNITKDVKDKQLVTWVEKKLRPYLLSLNCDPKTFSLKPLVWLTPKDVNREAQKVRTSVYQMIMCLNGLKASQTEGEQLELMDVATLHAIAHNYVKSNVSKFASLYTPDSVLATETLEGHTVLVTPKSNTVESWLMLDPCGHPLVTFYYDNHTKRFIDITVGTAHLIDFNLVIAFMVKQHKNLGISQEASTECFNTLKSKLVSDTTTKKVTTTSFLTSVNFLQRIFKRG